MVTDISVVIFLPSLTGKGKDPGIPNSWPFKEELLREAQQTKMQLAEDRERK